MRFARRLLATTFAVASLTAAAHAAPAASVEIYDGITYAQFKAALTATKLTITEKATTKGTKYLLIALPGLAMPIAATTMDCDKGQDQPCEGFTYLYLDEKNAMDATATSQFNRDYGFVKAMPSAGNDTLGVIQGEFYARGGVSENNVRMAGAYVSAVTLTYMQKNAPTAMNGAPSAQALLMSRPADADKFFADLTARNAGRPLPPASVPVAAEALIDAANARGH